ncbi:hypothetical protein E0H92_04285 [Kribbella speibonae]|uniref:Uncharacterized protein n=1 Tax=Kribbella speibonae TaxID=1572660 RepID=A0A4R0J578_9ACTN|nr:hypothetical protein E0H92_04285 [Kribbella speibonae]
MADGAATRAPHPSAPRPHPTTSAAPRRTRSARTPPPRDSRHRRTRGSVRSPAAARPTPPHGDPRRPTPPPTPAPQPDSRSGRTPTPRTAHPR